MNNRWLNQAKAGNLMRRHREWKFDQRARQAKIIPRQERFRIYLTRSAQLMDGEPRGLIVNREGWPRFNKDLREMVKAGFLALSRKTIHPPTDHGGGTRITILYPTAKGLKLLEK